MFLSIFFLSLNPTYKKDIKPIFANRCSKCHDSMYNRNWQRYQDAYRYRSQIKQEMMTKGMPLGQNMPQPERDLIVKWIDTGANE